MSYCRNDGETSDTYVFGHVGGFFECCGCRLIPMIRVPSWRINPRTREIEQTGKTHLTYDSFTCKTRSEMVAHLLAHYMVGIRFPKYAIDRLLEEIDTVGERLPKLTEKDR